MKIKKFIPLFIFIFFLSACGSKVDNEALENLANSLENRWEFTDQLPEQISVSDLENATQIELNILNEYNVDEFKDKEFFVLYNNYIYVLDDMLHLTKTKKIDDPDLKSEWRELLEKRAKILFDINSKYGIEVRNTETLNEVLDDSKRLVETERVEDSLKEIIDNINVLTEDDSVVIKFPVESVLSVDSFVAQKLGFPGTAMKILNKIKEYDYQNIVIASVNQNAIAVSVYFNMETLQEMDFSEWEKIDSYDGYKFYSLTNDFYIRSGILNQISSDYYDHISKINKNSNNDFWKMHGFTHGL